MSTNFLNILNISGQISAFNVDVSHMATNLSDVTDKLADISQSNLAAVEETTSTMTQVLDNVGYTSDRLNKLSEQSTILTDKNNESLQLLEEIKQLKEGIMQNTSQMSDVIMNLMNLLQEIDDSLTHSTHQLYKGIKMGIPMLTNKELVEKLRAIGKARTGQICNQFHSKC